VKKAGPAQESGMENVSAERSATSKRDRKNTTKEARERARAEDPGLAARYARYQQELGLAEEDADHLAGSLEHSDFFETAMAAETGGAEAVVSLANWIVNDLVRELKDRPLSALPVTPEQLAALVALREGDVISQPVAKKIFAEMVVEGVDPRAHVKERGLEKIGDVSALKPLVDKVLTANHEKVQEYKNGKTGLMGFFMGQIMRESQGKADPEVVQELIREGLGE
jgi:Asp-tRNA(Asn)/Glu-tRNA(Gln) amidotransferase B subunit